MVKGIRAGLRAATYLLAALLTAIPALAQVDLSGTWSPAGYQEDWDERIPGPDLVDYLGIPINDAARQWALSWDPARLALEEHQCQVHTAAYMYRGPLQVRIWEDRDPQSQEIKSLRQYISTYEQWRTIWMDGRPHPPDYAPHTWMGFSTGKWEGDILTVYTTHLKQGWHRRNGIPSGDLATLTEHYIRHGNRLTHVSIVNDPVYLTEPLIRTQDYNYNVRPPAPQAWLWPCEYVVEIADRPRDVVPSYMPGENPFVADYARKHGLSQEAVLGGAQTAYPEFMPKAARKESK
jgi:hypothetical protein